ncbi:hypothetical protein SAMN06265379_11072 [Saccharicrinis carchari]|uniref:Lipocalin-like domain-containing protein n=1 Tax=Saccharicrinis carchari TaxID=1168039 RepID=A0A521EPP5_SACCC|nr:hypothetical protein [Saccharicrinis carchari]SMO85896.1 hypothetical protein SAMN06265379_11072 [Saccharicrinis carchari]
MKNVWMIIATVTLMVVSMNVKAKEAGKSDKGILGTWKFEVNEAPYDYQRGKTTFYQEDSLVRVKIAFKYETITGSKLKIDGDKVSFNVKVQGELVNVALKLENDALIGKAVTWEGELPLVMKREVK